MGAVLGPRAYLFGIGRLSLFGTRLPGCTGAHPARVGVRVRARETRGSPVLFTTGRGRKLLMKYDGPFEILRKISPVSYQIRLPASYGIHPIINIAHLEHYTPSPSSLGDRPKKAMNQADFVERPEYEVDFIIRETTRKGRNGKRVPFYFTRFKGYGPDSDEWLSRQQLRNAPEILAAWHASKRPKTRGGN